jgi:hypothetical protein
MSVILKSKVNLTSDEYCDVLFVHATKMTGSSSDDRIY